MKIIKTTIIFIMILIINMFIVNGFTIYEDLNVIDNVTINGNYLCDDSLCYLISDLNSSSGSGTVTSISGDGTYITGTITTSGTLGFNETNLNVTIDARDTDTYNTTQEMRNAINITAFYQIFVDWVRVNNRPTTVSDFTNDIGYVTNSTANYTVDTWNTTEEMRTAVSSEDIYLLNTGDTATGNYTFDTNTLHIDSTNNRVGIGTSSPTEQIEFTGTILNQDNTGDEYYKLGSYSMLSSDPSFLSSRYMTGVGNGHGFADNTYFRRNGYAYNSFDAYAMAGGLGNNIDHLVAFQGRQSFNAGASTNTIQNMYGYYNSPSVVTGTAINQYHIKLINPSGTGNITNNYGVYIDEQTAGDNNYQIYSENGINYLGGSLGIGTVSPTYKLDVNGTSNFKDIIKFGDENADFSAPATMLFDVRQDEVNANTQAMYVYPSADGGHMRWYWKNPNGGNYIYAMDFSGVGSINNIPGTFSIGSNTDQAKITLGDGPVITGKSGESIKLYDYHGTMFYNNYGTSLRARIGYTDANTDAGNKVYLKGPVMIGTETSGERLTINGNVSLLNDNDKLYFGASKDSSITFDGSDTIFNNEVGTGDYVFNNGNVGIGTASPSYLLHVDGSGGFFGVDISSSNTEMVMSRGGYNRKNEFLYKTAGESVEWNHGVVDSDNAGNGTQFFIGQKSGGTDAYILLETNGDVGIGITPREKLHVDGNINVTAGNDICIEGGNCLSTAGGYSTVLSPLNESGSTIGLISCPDTQVLAFNATANAWECEPKSTGGGGTVTSVSGDGTYVTGTVTTSGTLGFNEVNLNTTIDARDTDTTYTAGGSYLYLTGTQFNFNETKANLTYINNGESGATILTPVLTLDSSASTTNTRISYDASNDWIGVGDGSALDTFVSTGTKTDEYLCSYESTGTKIDCDLATSGSGSAVRVTSATVTTPSLTLSTAASTTSGRIRYDATNDWVYVGDGSTADSFVPVNTKTDEYMCSYETTGTILECDTAKDLSGDCASGSLCTGDNTYTANKITNFDIACPSGYYVNVINMSDESTTCVADESGSFTYSDYFDQGLNTTSTPEFLYSTTPYALFHTDDEGTGVFFDPEMSGLTNSVSIFAGGMSGFTMEYDDEAFYGKMDLFPNGNNLMEIYSDDDDLNYVKVNPNDYLNIDLIHTDENGDALLYVDASEGNVGIGTSSPTEKLTIDGNISANDVFYVHDNGYASIGINDDSFPLYVYTTDGGASIVVQRDGQAQGYMNSNNAFMNFGTVNNFPLGLSVNAMRRFIIDNESNMCYASANSIGDCTSDPDIDFIINSNNNVGIGVITPGLKLEVEDNSIATALFRLDNSAGQCDHTPGSGSETVTCTSDERVKPYIQEVNTSRIMEELKARAVCLREYHVLETTEILDNETIEYNNTVSDYWKVGYSAQCLQTIAPQLVHEQFNFTGYMWNHTTEEAYFVEDETLLSVEQPDVNELLIGSIELYKRNKDLENEIDTIRSAGISLRQEMCVKAPQIAWSWC